MCFVCARSTWFSNCPAFFPFAHFFCPTLDKKVGQLPIPLSHGHDLASDLADPLWAHHAALLCLSLAPRSTAVPSPPSHAAPPLFTHNYFQWSLLRINIQPCCIAPSSLAVNHRSLPVSTLSNLSQPIDAVVHTMLWCTLSSNPWKTQLCAFGADHLSACLLAYACTRACL